MSLLLSTYNRWVVTHPFTTKAVGTGVTYFFSDLTAQALEARLSATPPATAEERLTRALKFASVGGLWVGPCLTAWFNVMDYFVPGRTVAAIGAKLVADQVLQGPFMIGSMYAICAALNGKTSEQIAQKIDEQLWSTWVTSVQVWGPVQVVQQAFVPLQFRVLVANMVSYVWDTWLSFKMMTDGPANERVGEGAKIRRRDTWRIVDDHD